MRLVRVVVAVCVVVMLATIAAHAMTAKHLPLPQRATAKHIGKASPRVPPAVVLADTGGNAPLPRTSYAHARNEARVAAGPDFDLFVPPRA